MTYTTGHCFRCAAKSHELLRRVIVDDSTGEMQAVYLCPVCRHQLDWIISDGETPARKNEAAKKLTSSPRYLLMGGKNL